LTDPAKPTLLQALGDKRMTAVLFLSFASGLPFNLTNFSLQAWLASSGIPVKTIGFLSLVALPYNVKFFWIAVFQVCLAICIAAMGFCDPTTGLYVLAGVAFGVAFLSASQDIVINAYQVDTIPASERALAAAASAFGYRTAAMLAGTVLVVIAGHLGWRIAFWLVAVLMAATLFMTFWAPAPRVPTHPPRTLIEAVWHPLRELFREKGMWGFIALVLLYKVGDALALSLYSTFMLRGVGFTLDELGIAGKLNMTVSTMIGVTIGGLMYIRWGTFRSLLVFGIGQALTNLLYMWLALAGPKIWLLVLATSLDTMIGGMGQAAFVAFLMSLCSADYSATQFALLSAIATLPRNLSGAAAGVLVPVVGWARFFIITCLAAMPGLILLIFMRRPLNALAARDTARSGA
jgi:PAT family beta-lactamase induction signal transducer AmpG